MDSEFDAEFIWTIENVSTLKHQVQSPKIYPGYSVMELRFTPDDFTSHFKNCAFLSLYCETHPGRELIYFYRVSIVNCDGVKCDTQGIR